MNNIQFLVKSFLESAPEGFSFKERKFLGKDMILITPQNMSVKWTNKNSIFRSCLCDKHSGYVYNLGFKKFTNYSEKPEFEPWNDEWVFEARHKLDGSLLCVSKYSGELIIRTRGTFDAREHDTGDEITRFIESHSKVFNNEIINKEDVTLLFEHTTPKRIIVLREHDVPTLTLLGVISNKTGEYLDQGEVDELAKIWEINRPQKYEYNSIAECIADVKAWQGKEGVVIYSPNYQTMKKIKGDAYCELHKLSTGLVTLENVLDLFLATPMFSKYSDFYHYVETTKDYEVAEKIKDQMLVICVAYSKVLDRIEKVKNVVNQVRTGFTRKEQAHQFQIHWSDWRLAVAFTLLDNRELTEKHYKTAILAEIGD